MDGSFVITNNRAAKEGVDVTALGKLSSSGGQLMTELEKVRLGLQAGSLKCRLKRNLPSRNAIE